MRDRNYLRNWSTSSGNLMYPHTNATICERLGCMALHAYILRLQTNVIIEQRASNTVKKGGPTAWNFSCLVPFVFCWVRFHRPIVHDASNRKNKREKLGFLAE